MSVARLQVLLSALSLLTMTSQFLHFLSSTEEESREPYAIRRPPCKILISNYRVDFHTEILESVLALFPSSSLHLPATCDRNHLEFDYILENHANARSWMKYFKAEIVNKIYNGTQQGETRVAGRAMFVASKETDYIETIKERYASTIEASCSCNDDFTGMMRSSAKTACIFHERCDSMKNNPRAVWVNPHFERYIFPTVLPRPTRQPKLTPTLPLECCVIGSTRRRNFRLLADFLDSLDTNTAKLLSVKLLGKGDFPQPLEGYRRVVKQENIKDFVEFQNRVATTCDIILPLVDKRRTPNYFGGATGKMKLSGSIVQSVAYDIPMVVHEELAAIYEREHRGAIWNTHSDDPKSFSAALLRLVETLSGSVKPVV